MSSQVVVPTYIHAYILSWLITDTTMTATPAINPMTVATMFTTSVATTSASDNSCHVSQLGTQISDPSSRKKSSRHGNRSEVVIYIWFNSLPTGHLTHYYTHSNIMQELKQSMHTRTGLLWHGRTLEEKLNFLMLKTIFLHL